MHPNSWEVKSRWLYRVRLRGETDRRHTDAQIWGGYLIVSRSPKGQSVALSSGEREVTRDFLLILFIFLLYEHDGDTIHGRWHRTFKVLGFVCSTLTWCKQASGKHNAESAANGGFLRKRMVSAWLTTPTTKETSEQCTCGRSSERGRLRWRCDSGGLSSCKTQQQPITW